MSKIKSLIEGAHRAVEMRWTVLCYDPEKDNELVETSKQFDCICAAQTHKRELAMKHPGYIIEIVAESKKAKNESIGQEIVDEVKEEIKAELKDAIGQDVDNAISHPATEENLGAEVKDDMGAEEDELAMEEDIDDDSDSIFAPDALDEVITESEVDDFKTKALGAIAILKSAGYKADTTKSNNKLISFKKGDKEVSIGLFDYGIIEVEAYDLKSYEDTYSDHWKIDKVSKSEIEAATKRAIKSFNESAIKPEKHKLIVKHDGKVDEYIYDTKAFADKYAAEYKAKGYDVEVVKESVTKANYNEIIKVLSDTIAKAAKKYPEAKLVKNYQATTGSHGTFLDEGLRFTDKDALSKALAVSKELQKAMSKYGFKDNIGGRLPYMMGNNRHSIIVSFGAVSQGSYGASVGYKHVESALKLLESAQKNEANHSKDFNKNIYTTLEKVSKAILKVTDSDYRKAQQTLGYAAICLTALQNYVNHVGQNTDEWLADHPTEADKYYKQAIDAANKL